jgi:hypothetical protein
VTGGSILRPPTADEGADVLRADHATFVFALVYIVVPDAGSRQQHGVA